MPHGSAMMPLAVFSDDDVMLARAMAPASSSKVASPVPSARVTSAPTRTPWL